MPRRAPDTPALMPSAAADAAAHLVLAFDDNRLVSALFGQYGQNLALIERRLGVVRKRLVRARTPAQDAYIRALRRHALVFGAGPAGTGKTWLAVAYAIALFERKEVDRIILSRPAVEAGERLGFLPGDMREKVDPYLRSACPPARAHARQSRHYPR